MKKTHLTLVYNSDNEKIKLMPDIMKFFKMISIKELRAFYIEEKPVSLDDKIQLRLLDYYTEKDFLEAIEYMLFNRDLSRLEEFHESIQDLI